MSQDANEPQQSGGKSEKQLSSEEAERRALLKAAEEESAQDLFDEGDGDYNLYEDEIKRLNDVVANHDPDAKHTIFYALQDILKKNLPNDQLVRRPIHDEKLILLNRGAKRGSDGLRGSDARMGSIEVMEEAIEIVGNWLRSGKNPYELYMAFYDANEARGYGHQD